MTQMVYCYHCMAPITDALQPYCPKCGKEYNVHISENYELPAGTFLGDGRYLIGRSIGTGGFGITYVGRDMKLEKRVVVKETFYSGIFERDCTDMTSPNPFQVLYDPEVVSLEEIVYKTQTECLSLSKGEKFTNIVKVYDYLFENNTAYIITEYINGKTLHDRVCAIGKYTWYDLYAKMKPLMQCLASLHREGLLHRDIKPQNIMIRRAHEYSEEFVLIDFGLARTTQSSALVESAFTPGFSPPEQKVSIETDGTYTDVYALAATMYDALTGEIPPEATSYDVFENFPQLNVMKNSPNIPPNVVDALIYALQPNYKKRCKTIDGLMYRLENAPAAPVAYAPQQRPVGVVPPPPGYQGQTANTVTPMRNGPRTGYQQPMAAPRTGYQQQAAVPPTGYRTAPAPYPTSSAASPSRAAYTPGRPTRTHAARDVVIKAPVSQDDGMFPLPLMTKTNSCAINYLHIMGIKQNGDLAISGGVKISPFAQISKEKIDFGKQLEEIKKDLKSDLTTLRSWNNLTSISTGGEHALSRHIVGLQANGSVVAVGSNDYGECETNSWKNVIAIYTGENYTVGLKNDGSVCAVGDNQYGQCEVRTWRNITAISIGASHTVGLHANGTVTAVGDNTFGQCNVDKWTKIIAISASRNHTVGLRVDGTVVACGDNQYGQCDVRLWTKVSAICTSYVHTVGLVANGMVLATGNNQYGQCEVKSWRNVSSIYASSDHTVGLHADGTVVACGSNDHGQCNTRGWENIMEIYTYYRSTVGLKWNGQVVATGFNDYGQCKLQGWKNIKLPRTTTM